MMKKNKVVTLIPKIRFLICMNVRLEYDDKKFKNFLKNSKKNNR